MVKELSLVNGIGNLKITTKYYDDWSDNYDSNLINWNYKVPEKSIKILKLKLKKKPKNILDLACGTGLFGQKIIKTFNKSQIYGSDISLKCLKIAKQKKNL